jgi:hypothetical protein
MGRAKGTPNKKGQRSADTKCISAKCKNTVYVATTGYAKKYCTPCQGDLKKYKITRPERMAMIDAIDWRCPICSVALELSSGSGTRENEAVIDHCHNSLEIRGVLCSTCNIGLGQFQDDVGNLQNAIKYLRKET